MRIWLLAIVLGAALTLGVLAPVNASAAASSAPFSASVMAPATKAEAASFAGTRVKVQLVTLGAVLVLVIGVGSAAYFVRRKLGLDVQNPPEAGSSSHH